MKDTINFYRQTNAYGEFSNFYYAPIVIDGLEWPTTEHYFQAQKFAHLPDSEYVEMIRVTPQPGSAAKMGRNRSWPLRPDWEEIKDDVMRACVLQKFLQHPKMADVLLGTGDRYLNGKCMGLIEFRWNVMLMSRKTCPLSSDPPLLISIMLSRTYLQ